MTFEGKFEPTNSPIPQRHINILIILFIYINSHPHLQISYHRNLANKNKQQVSYPIWLIRFYYDDHHPLLSKFIIVLSSLFDLIFITLLPQHFIPNGRLPLKLYLINITQ